MQNRGGIEIVIETVGKEKLSSSSLNKNQQKLINSWKYLDAKYHYFICIEITWVEL